MDKTFKEKVEGFCKTRKQSTITQDLIFLGEVLDRCPMCGKPLVYVGERRVGKKYEIAHIFPCNPTDDDMLQLEGVELYGDNAESMDNKIALCKDCHDDYDKNKTKEKYLSLLDIKKKVKQQYELKTALSEYQIEAELASTIEKLGMLKSSDLAGIELSYDVKTIGQKIEDKYLTLRYDIEANVSHYFVFIKTHIEQLCKESNSDMNIVSLSVKGCYLKCKQKILDKECIFSSLVDWVQSKTRCSETIARIIISYFVQSCDVYEEFSK